MLFNSLVFLLFFAILYPLYIYAQRNLRIQNSMLLLASYIFYGWWDWRFLSLLCLSTLIDYVVGQKLHNSSDEKVRKFWVTTSVVVNLTVLGFFKYFNFFADSFVDLFATFGLSLTPVELKVILPVGISFYTFQTLSYTIDIYRRRLEPCRNFWDFALFVSFFPQLVAGPIERAKHLLPQICSPRVITSNNVSDGIHLILWGFFKKLVIADNVALLSDQVFNNYTDYAGLDLILAALAFTVQIYCDFSAYTDIARGISKLMGFDLMLNFRLPYFSINPSDFWLRWHISLSSWLRDYLYIPLGGNRSGTVATYRNLFLTMLLGGLWHGASWNFVLWGAFHGLILVIYRVGNIAPWNDDPWKKGRPRIYVIAAMALMFCLTVIGWILFRCTSLDQIAHVFTNIGFSLSPQSFSLLAKLVFYASPLVLVQLVQYLTSDLMFFTRINPAIRGLIYGSFILGIFLFGVREATEFIYFQF